MLCLKCNSENLDEAVFCANCGADLTNTCPRCSVKNPSTAKFCIKCAMPLDGSVICSNCKSIIPSGSTVCSNCGKDKSGKAVCVNCKELQIDSSAVFCHNCGTPYKTAPIASYKTSVKTVTSTPKKKSLSQFIVAWIMVAVMAMLVGFSFLPIFKIEMPLPDFSVSIKVDGQKQTVNLGTLNVKANVSAIDIFVATFKTIKAPSQEEVKADFLAFFDENNTISVNDNINAIKAETVRMLDKFGILKINIFKESVATMPSMIIQLIIWCVAVFALMGWLLTFFIASLCNAIKLTINPIYKPKNINSWALSVAFGLSVLLGLLGGVKFGAGLITIMTISALTIVGLAVLKYALKQEKINVKQLIAQGVSFIMVLFMVGFVGAGGLTVKYQSEKINYKGEISSWNIIGGIDLTKREEAESQLNQENLSLKELYEAQIKDITAHTKKDGGYLLAYFLDPTNVYSFKETTAYIPFGIIISIITLLGYIVTAVGLGGVATFTLKDIGEAKSKKRNVYNILLIVGIFTLLVTGIITVVSANIILKELFLKAKYAIGGMSVVAMVFAVGHIIQYYILAPRK